MKALYPNAKHPDHSENIRLARLAQKGDKAARKKLIENNAGLAYNNAIRYSTMNKGRHMIDPDDLLQAAMVGLIEAVDKFNPEAGFKFVTYAHWWVNKRISEEIKSQHYRVKPPDELVRNYMYRRMSETEQSDYVETFISTSSFSEHTCSIEDTDKIEALDILHAANNAGLDATEFTVFMNMYDPETRPMDKRSIAADMGCPLKVVVAAEQSALEKIRVVMGI